MRRLTALGVCLFLTACAGATGVTPSTVVVPAGWTPRTIQIRMVGLGIPGGVRLAPGVQFAGGVVLVASRGDRMHGFSDLKIVGDDLLAVSDTGDLVRGQLVLDRRGRLTGLADLRIRSLFGLDGGPFSSKGEGDAESLAVTPDGDLIVGFEQQPRLWSFGRPSALGEPPVALAVPPVPPGNDGMEALAIAPNGWRVAGEGGGVWDCGPEICNEVVAPPATPIPVSEWRITGMDRDPAGPGWLVVQRLYREPVDMRARVQRMAGDGALGPVLLELSLPSTVDNFEGVAVVTRDHGLRLYILSDDNDDPGQRTLLLAFDVKPSR